MPTTTGNCLLLWKRVATYQNAVSQCHLHSLTSFLSPRGSHFLLILDPTCMWRCQRQWTAMESNGKHEEGHWRINRLTDLDSAHHPWKATPRLACLFTFVHSILQHIDALPWKVNILSLPHHFGKRCSQNLATSQTDENPQSRKGGLCGLVSWRRQWQNGKGPLERSRVRATLLLGARRQKPKPPTVSEWCCPMDTLAQERREKQRNIRNKNTSFSLAALLATP